jgi:hypothetical protein
LSKIYVFIIPEEKVVIIAANTTEVPKFLVINIAEKYINITLLARSFNTFIVYVIFLK